MRRDGHHVRQLADFYLELLKELLLCCPPTRRAKVRGFAPFMFPIHLWRRLRSTQLIAESRDGPPTKSRNDSRLWR